ncbi:MAG: cation:proton antiporter [Myxococcota bacterium]
MGFETLFFVIFAGGWLFGRIFEKIKLPGVLGMTLFGIGISAVYNLSGQLTQSGFWPTGFWEVVPFIKSLALIVILLRAGLGISRAELKNAGISVILMAFIPCMLEGLALMGLLIYFLDFSWKVAGLTSFMLAAVSPAVVVPSMLEIKSQGLGKRNGVITVILAGASVDDIFAITIFTMFLSIAIAGSQNTALGTITYMPVSLAGGLVAGLALGYFLAWWFKRHHEVIRATEKVLLLLASATFLVQVGNWIHLATLLGVMGTGFILLEKAEKQAHEIALKLGKIWIFAQIALFVIVGMSIDLSVVVAAGPKALLVITLGLVARSAGVMLATWPSKMDFSECIFCVIAYLPKATVQAALGGVALSYGLEEGNQVLAIAVLAIIFTAPLGLIGIRIGSRKLLGT